jgi:hypothetical protein
MVNFYTNPECTELLQELRFDDSYIEDIYGGMLQNVVEVGTVVTKDIYIKNSDADMVVVQGIEIDSPFITAVVENPRLSNGEISKVTTVLKPTLEEIQRVESIVDPIEKLAAKQKLLKGKINLKLYRITMP